MNYFPYELIRLHIFCKPQNDGLELVAKMLEARKCSNDFFEWSYFENAKSAIRYNTFTSQKYANRVAFKSNKKRVK